MDIFEKCFNYTDAKKVIEAGIYPYFHTLESGQDTEVIIEGKRTIMLGSNNYLGLTSDARVKNAAIKAIEKYGSGCTGSRFMNGTLDLHVKLEEKLASFLNKESAMAFSTGFQTNLGILSAIAGRNDYIICDNQNHASIVDGARLSFAKTLKYEHSDMEDLERILKNIDDKYGKLIVTDGVFSMEGDICNLPEIVRLAKKYGARVMVDDAHGFGMLGKYGRGTAEYYGLEDDVDIIMTTFSKSLASLGGVIAASEDVIHYVKHVSRPFIFSASIPPANAAAALEAVNILEAEPERVAALWSNKEYMVKGFERIGLPLGCKQTAIIPVMTWENERTFIITKMLLNEGVYVNPAIAPAVKPGQCLLRTSYTATHSKEQLDFALKAFEKVFSQL
ncbi:MAG: aminotransferase class I/II-fold pyridoxal phosphate-dependent enzyme [Acetivibrionales bacterium]|jgi:8-amino-7-oxononanoate synthase